VSAVNADKAADAYIYAATAAGVYRRRVAVSSDTSAIGSGAWEKVYVERKSSYENGSSQSNSGDENGFDQTNSGFADTENSGTYTPNGLSLIHDMCVDTARPGVVYLATANGVVKSADSGATWQDMTDSGLMIKDVTAIATGDGSRLYAAAGTDVYFYDQDRWKCVSAGVTLKTARDIVSVDGSVYAASEAGLYRMRIDVRREDRGDSDAAFTRDLPSIQAVQKAAIEYADADIDKIQQWRKQARNKAFLPDLDVGVNQDTSELWHWEGGSTTREYDDLLRKGKNVYEWDVSLSWDLGELIWNDAQTSIDTRARLLVQLRQDVLDEVTKLYFEYVRVRQEMDSLSFLDKKKLAEKQIRLAELAAQLNGLTGNFFSK
jgi:uncharacterized protein (DUF2147 family)